MWSYSQTKMLKLQKLVLRLNVPMTTLKHLIGHPVKSCLLTQAIAIVLFLNLFT